MVVFAAFDSATVMIASACGVLEHLTLDGVASVFSLLLVKSHSVNIVICLCHHLYS